MTRAALGLRAVRGGAAAVAVACDGPGPRVVLSTFLATAAEGDRLAYEPYHVAAEIAASGVGLEHAATAVAEGRRRQEVQAEKGLGRMLAQLQDRGDGPGAVALLVNRAGWITDLLQHSLSAPEHPPVAEGLAVRDALRFAVAQHGLPMVEIDEKTLAEVATTSLHMNAAALEAELKGLGATAGKPWRKEQKLACLAAWVTAAAG